MRLAFPFDVHHQFVQKDEFGFSVAAETKWNKASLDFSGSATHPPLSYFAIASPVTVTSDVRASPVGIATMSSNEPV